MFECTSAYKFDEDNPYKKSSPSSYESDKVYSRMYPDTLTYKEDCDIVFELQEDGVWYGHNTCKDALLSMEVGNISVCNSRYFLYQHRCRSDIRIGVKVKLQHH